MYTCHNLDIACNKLSSIKYMCLDLFLEEVPLGSILVNDHPRGYCHISVCAFVKGMVFKQFTLG